MNRRAMLSCLSGERDRWDMVVIGGGSTGVGIAVDAASRGYSVLVLEQSDFGKGTSSRSTKLIHGGVRYLQQGNISLVMEALKERGILRQNAPHLVHDLRFIVPNYDWWEGPFYGIGLKVYDMLAGRYGFGRSRRLSRQATLQAIPTLNTDGLRGGVQYYDGQFDDARLLINLAQTAAEQGAVLINYMPVVGLLKDGDNLLTGVIARDLETGQDRRIGARCVINATGPFCDGVRRLDEADVEAMVAPSQGIHLVFDKSFLPSDVAIMVPRTADKRVMFAIPWHGYALVGTTDTAIDEISLEPRPLAEEVDFVLDTAGAYLAKPPTRADVLSMFAGIRPLVKASAQNTASLSREHTLHISRSGLLTITGGKWTTYRHMAEECVNHAATLAKLEERPCVTRQLKIHGYHAGKKELGRLQFYGSDAAAVDDLVRSQRDYGEAIHADLPISCGQVVWAVRYEMARTVDDFLSRRVRMTFLNARAAIAAAPKVAQVMAAELGYDQQWIAAQVASFTALANGYVLSDTERERTKPSPATRSRRRLRPARALAWRRRPS